MERGDDSVLPTVHSPSLRRSKSTDLLSSVPGSLFPVTDGQSDTGGHPLPLYRSQGWTEETSSHTSHLESRGRCLVTDLGYEVGEEGREKSPGPRFRHEDYNRTLRNPTSLSRST